MAVEIVAVVDNGGFVGAGLDAAGDFELDDECDESEGDGVAAAIHGVASCPAPMPSATANAPTRLIWLAYPMVVPSLGRVTV